VKVINLTNGGIIMGDKWDYKLKKVEMAWDLANRIIPKNPEARGLWGERDYLKNAQEILKQAHEGIDAVFTADIEE
jgi:hypothetical protein